MCRVIRTCLWQNLGGVASPLANVGLRTFEKVAEQKMKEGGKTYVKEKL